MRNCISLIGIALAISTLGSGVYAQEASKKVISTPAAPKAIGPYSQGVRVGKTLYIAGEIAIDPETNQVMSSGTIEEQTHRVMDNIAAIVAADGLSMDDVVSTTVYLTDIGEFGKMNSVYGAYFKDAPSARATVQVARLARDVKIEISAIAVAP